MHPPSDAPPSLSIDLSGLFCPQVVLEIARRVRENPQIERFEIVSTDPLSAIDIPVYAARNGLDMTGPTQGSGGQLAFRLERRRQDAPPAA